MYSFKQNKAGLYHYIVLVDPIQGLLSCVPAPKHNCPTSENCREAIKELFTNKQIQTMRINQLISTRPESHYLGIMHHKNMSNPDSVKFSGWADVHPDKFMNHYSGVRGAITCLEDMMSNGDFKVITSRDPAEVYLKIIRQLEASE
jgi:hypothetical protein